MKLSYHASPKPRAQKGLEELKGLYGSYSHEEADVIVVLGGDGSMLSALHKTIQYNKPLYGMNLGTLGFLHNNYSRDGLIDRINSAVSTKIRPLEMKAKDKHGEIFTEVAFNDVSLLRETHHTASLQIKINDIMGFEEIVCDGLLLSTPMGSTAYNSSAGGPILPLDSNVMPLTPISPFRPRRWPGALIKNTSKVEVNVLNSVERPVSATADSHEIRNVKTVTIKQCQELSAELLFDPDNHLDARIFDEQFMA